jgi:membrane protease subunit HflK
MENVLKNAEKIIMDSNGGGSGVVPYLPLNALGTKSDKANEGSLKQ